MADQFARQPVELDSPGRQFFAITPTNNVDIPLRPRALWVGVAGSITCRGDGGIDVLFSNLTVGWHPIGPVQIQATGTTASGIVGVV
jgi:hypothetical protein